MNPEYCKIAESRLNQTGLFTQWLSEEGVIIKEELKDNKHICCDGECNHDDCCGKVEANCPLLKDKTK